MRIGGLASGMDTDAMVEQLMKAESVKVDKVKAEQQIMEWQKEGLNDLNKDFANFILDSKKDLGYNETTGRAGEMDWVKEATSSDDKIGTAIAGKGAFPGTHVVNIEKLAEGVSGVSANEVHNTTWTANKETKGALTNKEIGAFDLDINDKKVSILAQDSLETIAKKINAANAGVQASFDDKLGRFFIKSEKEGTSSKIELKAFQQMKSDGKTLDQDKVNTNIDGVNAFLNTINVKIDKSGPGSVDPSNDKMLSINDKFVGTSGKATYNGLDITNQMTSNQFNINGVEFNAKAIGKFTVTVNNNADEIVDKVKAFVENYNKMIEKASNLVNEKKNRNFQPLTSEQRKAMTEKEVEEWDKKSKSGLLKGDMDIERMLSSLRTELYKDIKDPTGMFKNITQIGVTTQGYKAGGVGGLLQIDEKKLRQAIANDADGVMEVLFKENDKYAASDDNILATNDRKNGTNTLKEKREKSGLVTRVFDTLVIGMKDLIGKSGPGKDDSLFRKVKSTMMSDFVKKGGRYSRKGSVSDLDDDLLKFTKKIDLLNASLFKKENMYYAKFTAMEKAMQNMASQSGWLGQQM